jgi:hypothetical protein
MPTELEPKEGMSFFPAANMAPANQANSAAYKDSQWAQSLALLLLYSIPAFWSIRTFKILDPDIWWHLATGRWILQHHMLPTNDPFSAYGMDKPWYVYSWMFDLTVEFLYRWFGFVGIVLYEIAVRVVVPVALFHLVRSLIPNFWRAVIITAVSLYAVSHVLTPRPGMITILFCTIELDVLLAFRKSGKPKSLWLLPVLFALWANWHIQFAYGLLILGVFAVEPILDAMLQRQSVLQSLRSTQPLWLTNVGCMLATFLNPYGPRVYSTILVYMNQPKSFALLDELRAMSFRQPQHYVAMLLALAAAMAIGWRREKRLLWPMLLCLACVLGFRSVKDVWFIAVVSACAIADGWLPDRVEASRRITWRERLLVPIGVLAVLAVAVRHYDLANSWLEMQVAGNFPEVACQYIEKHHLQGPLYNDLNWGGFVIWRLPGYPVSIDGRTNVHGDDRVGKSISIWTGKPEWRNAPELAHANVILARKTTPLASLLRLDPRFKIVFEDQQAIVFQPR